MLEILEIRWIQEHRLRTILFAAQRTVKMQNGITILLNSFRERPRILVSKILSQSTQKNLNLKETRFTR